MSFVVVVIAALIGYTALYLSIYVVCVVVLKLDVWKAEVVLNCAVASIDVGFSFHLLHHAEVAPAAIWAGMAGFNFWRAYDTWRRNRKRKNRLGRLSGWKVVDLGGRLKVVAMGPQEARS